MVITKGGIFNVCKIIIRNSILAFKMNFIQKYIFDIFNCDEITISKGKTEGKASSRFQHLCDGYSEERKNTQSKPRKREVAVGENKLLYVWKILSI